MRRAFGGLLGALCVVLAFGLPVARCGGDSAAGVQAQTYCVHGLTLREDGVPLAGVKVAFLLNGRFIGEKETNASGAFMFCVNASAGAEGSLVCTPPWGWQTKAITPPSQVQGAQANGDGIRFKLTAAAPDDFRFWFMRDPASSPIPSPAWGGATATPPVTPPLPPAVTPTRAATPVGFLTLPAEDRLAIEDMARRAMCREREPLQEVMHHLVYQYAAEYGLGAQLSPIYEYRASDGRVYLCAAFCEAIVVVPFTGTLRVGFLEYGGWMNWGTTSP